MIYDLYHVRVALVGLWLLISLKHGGRALLNLRWKLFLQNITQKGKQQMHIMKPCNIKNWCHAFLGSFDSHQQKNNLVFHGIEPDKMERDMAMVGQKQRHGNDWLLFGQCWLKRENPWMVTMKTSQEPDFCRDILETRIKMLLREHLKISRDISFFKVEVTSLRFLFATRWRGFLTPLKMPRELNL